MRSASLHRPIFLTGLHTAVIVPHLFEKGYSAKPGEVIRPIETERGYHLFMVEKFIQAELTPERYQEILHNLFNQWLANEVHYLLYNCKV